MSMLSTETILSTINGLSTQRSQIDRDLEILNQMLDERSYSTGNAPVPVKTAASTKKVPAKTKRRPVTAPDSDKPKTKRKMSPAARKRIADAQKARWDKYRKAQPEATADATPAEPEVEAAAS